MERTKSWFRVLACFGALALSAPAFAAMELYGTSRVIPTWYNNFDFDKSKSDAATLNEGGWAQGPHVRGEFRLGARAKGEKWSVNILLEADMIMEKDTVDRSFYTSSEKGGQPNQGAEFGIERLGLEYAFDPAFVLKTGWEITALDIRTGGLLYGDDHPYIGFYGKMPAGPIDLGYEALYMPIQNRTTAIGVRERWNKNDWTVWMGKVNATVDTGMGKLTASPFYAFSDNDARQANIHYYGAELYGQVGPVKPALELVGATGEFKDTSRDIRAWAAFAGVEVPVTKVFNPYAALRFSSGDDDQDDSKVKGWVGITDIARFTPMIGMDGNILSEHLAAPASIYGATLYAYAPERAVGGNVYGGIGNAGSGNNPGQLLYALGASGDLSALAPGLSYKTQAFFIFYDKTDNLVNVRNPGKKVDDYAGTTFDFQVRYALSKNFSMGYIFSTFVPGDGIRDQVDANDPAYVNSLTFAWAY
ncbi:MAG: hypothetical protein ACNA8S_07030 [Deferrisomatales bacterium]